MSGVSFWEFLFICMIGLVVLGPERLPKVANQLGSWVGQARRMTRTMRRQLEEEINLDVDIEEELGIKSIGHAPPRDDDTYSPLHSQAENLTGSDATAPARSEAEKKSATETQTPEADATIPDQEQPESVQDQSQNQSQDNEQQRRA